MAGKRLWREGNPALPLPADRWSCLLGYQGLFQIVTVGSLATSDAYRRGNPPSMIVWPLVRHLQQVMQSQWQALGFFGSQLIGFPGHFPLSINSAQSSSPEPLHLPSSHAYLLSPPCPAWTLSIGLLGIHATHLPCWRLHGLRVAYRASDSSKEMLES
jgi:hypothetical protein